MVAAQYKKHQNDVNKCERCVHTQELNWVQNNSIFLDLDSIQYFWIESLLKKKNKILINHTFHLKNYSDITYASIFVSEKIYN
jgi:hypothetical protein